MLSLKSVSTCSEDVLGVRGAVEATHGGGLGGPQETIPSGHLEASPRPSALLPPLSPAPLGSSRGKVLSLNSVPGQHILHRIPGLSGCTSIRTVSDPDSESLQC